jgi:hypothetical protein
VISAPDALTAEVRSLVFVTAFQQDAAETAGALNGKFPGSLLIPENLVVREYPGGVEIYLHPKKFAEVYAGDAGERDQKILAAAQKPFNPVTLEGSFAKGRQLAQSAVVGGGVHPGQLHSHRDPAMDGRASRLHRRGGRLHPRRPAGAPRCGGAGHPQRRELTDATGSVLVPLRLGEQEPITAIVCLGEARDTAGLGMIGIVKPARRRPVDDAYREMASPTGLAGLRHRVPGCLRHLHDKTPALTGVTSSRAACSFVGQVCSKRHLAAIGVIRKRRLPRGW